MKKIALLITSALFTTVSMFAQETNLRKSNGGSAERSAFSIAPKIGFGHAGVSNTGGNNIFNPTWNGGLSFIYSPWEHSGLGIDLLYSTEGNKTDAVTNRLSYLRVPINYMYIFNTYADDFRPKISFGPTLGFLINKPAYLNASSFDAGINGSLGFYYRLVNAVWLSADVNYYQGLMDVYPSAVVDAPSTSVLVQQAQRNNNVRLNLGLYFGF